MMKDLPKPILGILIFAVLVVIALIIYWCFVVKARFAGVASDSSIMTASDNLISFFI